MCIDCWKKYGEPLIINHKTKKASSLIKNVFRYHGAGGKLHIVIDDWNLEDCNIRFCEKNIREEKTDDLKLFNSEKKCLDALKALSIKERASSLAISHGFKGGQQ